MEIRNEKNCPWEDLAIAEIFFFYFKLQANDLSGKTPFTTITFVFGKYTNEESNEGVWKH